MAQMNYKDDQDGSGCWGSIQSMFGTKEMINHTAKIDDSRLKFLKVPKSGEFSGRYGFRYWWVGKFHGDWASRS